MKTSEDRYAPIVIDLDAAHARWMKHPGYAEAYAALGELLHARKAVGMTQTDVTHELRTGGEPDRMGEPVMQADATA
ncbi:MAG: hypothetical protein JSR26_12205 [Proteobacteria bacterium]|nr:hypothetical protein [Pseudomonadota bacterium]